ncbi:MAG: WD40 repeat domain-containing protein [Pedosphaera sp.]|nr:WD40 repeat domain-containing protein [Pedosphaera sp.]
MSSILVPAAEWSATLADPIEALTWSPDGTRVGVAGVDGRLLLLDAANGCVTRELPGHAGGAFRIAWHPRDAVVASSGQDGRVQLWDPETGANISSFPAGQKWVEHLEWSPDGAWLAAGAGRTLTLWNWQRRVVTHEIKEHSATLTELCWRGDGQRVAAASYGGIQVWDPLEGKHTDTLPCKTSLISAAWSPDNRWIVAGTQELSVQIWELPFRPGEELAMRGFANKVRQLAWHHSGRYLATGGSHDATVWDCCGAGPAGTEPERLQGHSGTVTTLDYQRSGNLLASGGADGLVLLWNFKRSITPMREFQLRSPLTRVRWSPAGTAALAGCHDGTVHLLRPPSAD